MEWGQLITLLSIFIDSLSVTTWYNIVGFGEIDTILNVMEGEKTIDGNKELEIIEIFKIAASALLGGFLGAFIQWRVTRSHRKEQVALDILSYFLGIYSDIANAQHYLCSRQLEDLSKQNTVRRVGTWMNLIAFLYSRNSLDKNILERCGVLDAMETFHGYINKYNNNPIKKANVFQGAWGFWPDLNNFVIRK